MGWGSNKTENTQQWESKREITNLRDVWDFLPLDDDEIEMIFWTQKSVFLWFYEAVFEPGFENPGCGLKAVECSVPYWYHHVFYRNIPEISKAHHICTF